MTWATAAPLDDKPCWIDCRCARSSGALPPWCPVYEGFTLAGRLWPFVVHTMIGERQEELAERWAIIDWFRQLGADGEGVSAASFRHEEGYERFFVTRYFADPLLASAFKLRFGGREIAP